MSVPSSPPRDDVRPSSSPSVAVVDTGDSSSRPDPGARVARPPETNLTGFDDNTDPYTWINFMSTILEDVEETARVRTALRLFKGNRILFAAALRPPPKSWEEFVAKFNEHFIDKRKRSVSPVIRLTNFAASLNAISEDTILKLEMLARDASLEEADAVELVLDHLPKSIFPTATSFMGRKFNDLGRVPAQQELEPIVANVAQTRQARGGCHICGSPDHWKRYCPKRQINRQAPRQPRPPQPQGQSLQLPPGFILWQPGTTAAPNRATATRQIANKAETSEGEEINNRYACSRVQVLVKGRPVEAIVDTGANVVIISGALARRTKLRVTPSKSITIKTASGVDAEITGIAYEVPITIGGETKYFDAIVMKTNAYDVLLGTNALHAFEATIEFARRQLVISKPVGKVEVPISFMVGERPMAHITVQEELNIPAYTQMFAPVKFDTTDKLEREQTFYVQTANRACVLHGIVLAQGIFEGKKPPRQLLMANLTHEDVKITAGTTVGEVHICTEKIANLAWDKHVSSGPDTSKTKLPSLAHLNSQAKQQIEPVVQEYEHMFEEVKPGSTRHGVEHTIKLTDEKPIKQHPYRNSRWEDDTMQPEIERLLKEGFIEESTSPYAAPVILVPKPDGKLRICVDYRKLNAITMKEKYPMPRTDETLEQLHGAKIFSTLDLKSGYWQVPVAKQDRHKTAFVTKYGLFQWTCMPFGLCNAPATFQRLMDVALKGLKWECCLVYLDDVIVYSRTVEEHAKHLRRVFAAIDRAGLKLNADKCKFAVKELTYLGHIVSEKGIQPDKKNVEPVLKIKNPTNEQELRILLGIYGYYRRFIKDFSIKAEPLFSILRTSTKFNWGKEQQEARDYLSNALINRPILAFPDFSMPFIVQTDASDTGMGAVLAQMQDGKERVISYASQALDATQRKYATTEKEALAIVWAVQQFRPFIHGRHFKLVTDHSALTYIFEGRTRNSKLTRMALILQEYDFEAIYRKGKANGNADALSRLGHAFRAETGKEDMEPSYRVTRKGLYFGNRIVPAKAEREKIVKQYHSATVHTGKESLLNLIRKTYYWPEMEQDVKRITKSCPTCQAHGKSPLARAPIPIKVEYPFKRIGIDMVGPLTPSKRGNRYVVVATDYFTHLAIAAPLPQKSADLVAQFLHRYVNTVYGPPAIIQSDQGREFVNQVIAEMLRRTKTKQHLSSPYHPMANGLVERTNQSLMAKVAKLANKQKDTWDDALYEAVYGYNISPQRLLTVSPYEALFGRTPRVTGQETSETCNLQQLHSKIKERINENKEKTIKENEQLPQPDELQEGAVVLLRNRTRTKLAPRWLGPFYVKEKGTKGSYFITNVGNMEHTQQVHRDDIRPFLGGDNFEDLICTEDSAKAGEGVMSAITM